MPEKRRGAECVCGGGTKSGSVLIEECTYLGACKSVVFFHSQSFSQKGLSDFAYGGSRIPMEQREEWW